MYCQKCGQQIDDEAVMCPHCGELTVNYAEQTRRQPTKTKEKTNWAILKLIFGVIYLLNGLLWFGRNTARMVCFLLIGGGLLLWWFAKDWAPKDE